MFNYRKATPEECEFVEVASTDEIPIGGRLLLEIDDEQVVVFNIAGDYFAIADLCSHDEGPLGDGNVENIYEISCPRHGAHFDIKTGKALTFPAVVDIPAYPIRVIDGKVELGFPIRK